MRNNQQQRTAAAAAEIGFHWGIEE